MKRPERKRLLDLSLGALAVAVVALVASHFVLVDGLDGWFWSLTLDEDTVYAPGYSDRAFRRVRPGMPIAEVHTLLGPPLERWETPFSDPGELGERWSRSAEDSNYRCRVVVFRDGRVIRKHAEFYVD